MGAPVGGVVGLYMDTHRTIAENDVIQNLTGRTYRVQTVRRQERGIHTGRWHLRVLVIRAEDVQDGDHIIRFAWYPRQRKGSK